MWESLSSRLDKWAWERPDHPAVIQAARRISYRKLNEHACALAQTWLEQRIQPGERVVSYCGNTLEAIVTLAACRRCGAVFVPLNPSIKPSKLQRLLQELEPVILVASRGKLLDLGRVATEVETMPRVLVTDVESDEELSPNADTEPAAGLDVGVFWEYCLQTEEARQAVKAEDDAPAAILYTADAEGTSCGVVLSNENLAFSAESMTQYVRNTADDVILTAIPISLGAGFHQTISSLHAGATLVLEPSFTYPAAVLQRIDETHATGFSLVPSMAGILLHVDVERFDLSSLRYVLNLCGPPAPEHVERLQEAFPHAQLFSIYGRTECLQTACLDPGDACLASTRVGTAAPGVETRVLDSDGKTMQPEVDGELFVRGPNVMLGYWRQPEATGQVLRTDAKSNVREFHGGDVFSADLDGNLHFVGHGNEVLDICGEVVSPKEVEATLRSHPAVIDAVVYGDEDELFLDHCVCAVVRLRRGEQVTSRELQQFCAEHLEDFMVPAVVRIRHQALPKANLRNRRGATQSRASS